VATDSPKPSQPKIAPAHKSLGRFWIGLAVVAAVVLMGLSAWRQGWFTPTEHLYVDLTAGTQGMQVGTQVKLKGFKIGEVDELTLQPNLNVRLRMRVVEERLDLLGQDAQVKFTRDTPIGAKYIELLPGNRANGALKGETTLKLNTGSDVEDVMFIVKGVVEKVSTALSKIEPILDDVKLLSAEAASMRGTVHSSVDVMLVNLKNLTAQLKEIGQTANGMATKVDADRAIILGQIKGIVQTLEATIAKDVPLLSGKAQTALDHVKDATANAKDVTANVKTITADAAVDLPPALRSARSLTQDIAEITDGAKHTWPVSSFVKPEPAAKPLPLDAFEGKR
jgi:phospholipid/cholesterol/gamma-HCH transport system substrate-binding protein